MQATRCFAVLEGSVPRGKILVDDLLDPQWALVQEAGDTVFFLAETWISLAFDETFVALRQEGDVLIGMPPQTIPGLVGFRRILTTTIVYWSSMIVPQVRASPSNPRQVPAGCVI